MSASFSFVGFRLFSRRNIFRLKTKKKQKKKTQKFELQICFLFSPSRWVFLSKYHLNSLQFVIFNMRMFALAIPTFLNPLDKITWKIRSFIK